MIWRMTQLNHHHEMDSVNEVEQENTCSESYNQGLVHKTGTMTK